MNTRESLIGALCYNHHDYDNTFKNAKRTIINLTNINQVRGKKFDLVFVTESYLLHSESEAKKAIYKHFINQDVILKCTTKHIKYCLVQGFIDEPITVELASKFLDWKSNYKKHFKIPILEYKAFEDHFKAEYSSIFLTPVGVYIAI